MVAIANIKCRLDLGKKIHMHMKTHNFKIENTTYTSLLKMYTKCNSPDQVLTLVSRGDSVFRYPTFLSSLKIICRYMLFGMRL